MIEAPASAPPPAQSQARALLGLEGVSKHFRVRTTSNPLAPRAVLKAVDDVSLSIAEAETYALVGESGSGKSTLGQVALRLLEPTSGRIVFDGTDITHLPDARMRRLRSGLQVIFQDPLGSLNPRMRVAQIVAEPLRVLGGLTGSELEARTEELIKAVGLDPSRAGARPRSLSGGQRQRVGIARAIALNPRLILADEATSALDVSVQAQIVNLLVDLREQLGLSYLFIGHGLPVVRQISQRVGVMYLGRIVEDGPTDEVFAEPRHPYTRALIAASPVPRPGERERVRLAGEPPDPLAVPTGCRFRSRCPLATELCANEAPPVVTISPGHTAECHYVT